MHAYVRKRTKIGDLWVRFGDAIFLRMCTPDQRTNWDANLADLPSDFLDE